MPIQKLDAFLENVVGAEVVEDGVIAENETQVFIRYKHIYDQ